MIGLLIIAFITAILGATLMFVNKRSFHLCVFITIIVMFLTTTILVVATPITLKQAHNELARFEENKAMIEQVIKESYSSNKQTGIANEVIKQNQWLVNAKTNKAQYKWFSMYYTLDLDNVEYISINA